MNKKQFQKVVSLHKEGVDTHTCVVAILQIVCGYENSSVAFRTAAEDIDKFYNDVVIKNKVNKIRTKDQAIQMLQDMGMKTEYAIEMVYGKVEGK